MKNKNVFEEIAKATAKALKEKERSAKSTP